MASSLGADSIGLNFYRQSPRFITETQAPDIIRALWSGIQPVGVFVNEPLGYVRWTAQMAGGIEVVQIHGEHTDVLPPRDPTRRDKLRDHVLTFIPAFGVKDQTSLAKITAYLEQQRSQFGAASAVILVDAHVVGMHGGTGRTVPWELLADFRPGVKVMLAGGLTPENVAEAIGIVRPYAVDVASGVESAPGKKDPEKLRRFIENARAAG